MTELPVRVTVLDTWEELHIAATPDTLVRDLKAQALAQARVTAPAEAYLVKYRGAELGENGLTLEQAGVVPNAPLIVLSRRRVPAR